MKRNSMEDSKEEENAAAVLVAAAASSSCSNHGVQWVRGPVIGKGSFGSVFIACLKPSVSEYSIFPPLMAVKSAEVSDSQTLQKEKLTYDNLYPNSHSSNLIQCFGEETTFDHHGRMVYNLLLEFAAGGDLAQRIKTTGGKGLPETEVREYTRSIIKGLIHIHKAKYVHCDLKPANILLVPRNSSNGQRFTAKIGDLGLARRISKTKARGYCLGGTVMYMAPETLIHSVQESSSDIWALGCLVLQMLTGNRPWTAADKAGIAKQIIEKHGMPYIPEGVSEEASGFLKCCFVRKPEFRFTAEMLMNLPFVAAAAADEEEDDFVTAPTFVEINRRTSKRQRVSIKIVRKINGTNNNIYNFRD